MRNFGKIKNTFNTLLVEGIAEKNSKNKAIFGKFIKTIKESNILKTQFNVYYNIEQKCESNEIKSSEFVKESIGLLSKFKKEDIENENKKLISILEKYDLKVLEEPYLNSELHENISNLVFTSKNSKNLDFIVESLEKVITYVNNNLVVEKQKSWTNDFLPNSFVGNLMVEKFNSKYNGLTEDEKKLINTITKSDNSGKENLLKVLTTECLELINGRLKESNATEEKEALLNVKEALLTMEFSNESFISNISRIIELKKAFND